MYEWKANNYSKTNFNIKREFALGSSVMGEWNCVLTFEGIPEKGNQLLSYFDRDRNVQTPS